MQNFQLLIDGSKLPGGAGEFAVLNPATGEPLAQCPAGTLEQLNHAVEAARSAFSTWRSSTTAERRERLHKAANDIEREAEELAKLIVGEQGKPMALAMSEVMGGGLGSVTTPTSISQ